MDNVTPTEPSSSASGVAPSSSSPIAIPGTGDDDDRPSQPNSTGDGAGPTGAAVPVAEGPECDPERPSLRPGASTNSGDSQISDASSSQASVPSSIPLSSPATSLGPEDDTLAKQLDSRLQGSLGSATDPTGVHSDTLAYAAAGDLPGRAPPSVSPHRSLDEAAHGFDQTTSANTSGTAEPGASVDGYPFPDVTTLQTGGGSTISHPSTADHSRSSSGYGGSATTATTATSSGSGTNVRHPAAPRDDVSPLPPPSSLVRQAYAHRQQSVATHNASAPATAGGRAIASLWTLHDDLLGAPPPSTGTPGNRTHTGDALSSATCSPGTASDRDLSSAPSQTSEAGANVTARQATHAPSVPNTSARTAPDPVTVASQSSAGASQPEQIRLSTTTAPSAAVAAGTYGAGFAAVSPLRPQVKPFSPSTAPSMSLPTTLTASETINSARDLGAQSAASYLGATGRQLRAHSLAVAPRGHDGRQTVLNRISQSAEPIPGQAPSQTSLGERASPTTPDPLGSLSTDNVRPTRAGTNVAQAHGEGTLDEMPLVALSRYRAYSETTPSMSNPPTGGIHPGSSGNDLSLKLSRPSGLVSARQLSDPRATFSDYSQDQTGSRVAASAHAPAPMVTPAASGPAMRDVQSLPSYPVSVSVDASRSATYNPAGLLSGPPSISDAGTAGSEEITTIFVVGFPEDFEEREFQNMFTFAKGFEAATLKIPASTAAVRERDAAAAAAVSAIAATLPSFSPPAGPSALDMSSYGAASSSTGPPSYDHLNNSLYEEAFAAAAAAAAAGTATGTATGTGTGIGGGSGVAPTASAQKTEGAQRVGQALAAAAMTASATSVTLSSQSVKKQIIGFAKFRTREQALEAREILSGRKIDVDKNCTLKAEMAKKNLHTKKSTSEPQTMLLVPSGTKGGNSQLDLLALAEREQREFSLSGRQHTSTSLGTTLANAPSHTTGSSASLREQSRDASGPEGFDQQLPQANVRVDHRSIHGQMYDMSQHSRATEALYDPFRRRSLQHQLENQHQHQHQHQHQARFPSGSQHIQHVIEHEEQSDLARIHDALSRARHSEVLPPSVLREEPYSSLPVLAPAQHTEPEYHTMTKETADPHGRTYHTESARHGTIYNAAPSHHEFQHDYSHVRPSNPETRQSSASFAALGNTRARSFTAHSSFGKTLLQQLDEQGGEGDDLPLGVTHYAPTAGFEASAYSNGPGSRRQPPPPLPTQVEPPAERRRAFPEEAYFALVEHREPVHAASAGSDRFRQLTSVSVPSQYAQRSHDPPLPVPDYHAHQYRPMSHGSSGSMKTPTALTSSASYELTPTAAPPLSPELASPTYTAFGGASLTTRIQNRADDNMPISTLYVGGLPAVLPHLTGPLSAGYLEDALRSIFAKCPGFKRLSFRQKSQGPMCFVEFEDVHHATKALTEMYGHTLGGLVKGGIRLAYSKNPLGVRSHTLPSGPLSPSGTSPSYFASDATYAHYAQQPVQPQQQPGYSLGSGIGRPSGGLPSAAQLQSRPDTSFSNAASPSIFPGASPFSPFSHDL